ncbi:MAG TPA: hypothetical protein VNV41_20910, partial [Candidatus Acidoferrales bacterium]|nr:hypothetical protein [Candidatus Acidoferrales bacterium]
TRSRALIQQNTALFRLNRVQHKRSGPFEKYYRINRLEGCCTDRLSRHLLSGDRRANVIVGLADEPYNIRDFSIRDPNGGKIVFGQDL